MEEKGKGSKPTAVVSSQCTGIKISKFWKGSVIGPLLKGVVFGTFLFKDTLAIRKILQSAKLTAGFAFMMALNSYINSLSK